VAVAAAVSLPGVLVSGASPFAAGCDGAVATGTLYADAEVEPSAAVNPAAPANVIAAWQQDRWSDGGSHGLVTAASFDGGHTWTTARPMVSICAGGSAANGGHYERASDPWLTFAADGTAYLLSLSFTGGTLAAGSTSAMLVTRSTDGGLTWSLPATLIADGSSFFNDKGSITADLLDPHYVYAVWDRLDAATGGGPTYFARTADSGASWAAARSIYDPGAGNQTIGNILVGLPGGVLLVVFTELDTAGGVTTGTLKVMRSADHGDTWGTPVVVAAEHPSGTRDPESGAAVRDGGDLPSIAVDRSGAVYVAWQDASVSGGLHDGIALSRSLDGGSTWSAPVRLNGSIAVAAFIPSVRVRDDGVIGVGYYDFRSSTGLAGRPATDYWLATSTDGVNWSDAHVKGPFSLRGAPVADGLFLGDYQALVASGSEFLPLFVATTGNAADPTDVFGAFDTATAAAAGVRARASRVGSASATVVLDGAAVATDAAAAPRTRH
jgi:hypothetical protein